MATAALLGTALLTLAVGYLRAALRSAQPAAARRRSDGRAPGWRSRMSSTSPSCALVAFVGTINPSTGDLGVLVPLEHRLLAHGVRRSRAHRTFARYSLIGALSQARPARWQRRRPIFLRSPASAR